MLHLLDRIFAYLKRRELPQVSNADLASLEELRRDNDVVVVAYLDAKDTASQKQFAAIAEELRDNFVFAVANNNAAVEAEKISTPSFVVYKKVAETKIVLEGPLSEVSLETFVREATKPLVAEIHPELHRDYLEVCYHF
jgi:protein disulfide-isomerase A1